MKLRISKIRFKQNVILQYTVVTFAVTFAISFLLGFLLSKSLTEQAIDAHTSFFPKIVAQIAKGKPQVYSFLTSSPDLRTPEELEAFASELQSFGAVFRVKVWDKNGTIVWSNKKQIIGRNFKEDKNFQQAARGITNSLFKLPDKAENRSERNAGVVLEIYTPLMRGNEAVGVVELYEAAHELVRHIEKNMAIIWSLVAASGIIIYALLFFIFFKAHRVQKAAAERLQRTLDAIIYALAYLAEIRDIETGRHLERTALYVELIAKELRRLSPYSHYVTELYLVDLVKAAPLHDVGKVGVLDAILRKPGKLTPEEFTEIQKHAAYGATILTEANKKLGFRSLLSMAIQIAQSHHERWDGKGYPQGLTGEAIPLSARIMALADVYDALRSKRCYKEALTHAQSREIIVSGKGTQFDPVVVDAFLSREKAFEKISLELAD